MGDTTPGDVTRLLLEIGRGNEQAADRLIPLVYGELRRLARARMAHEPAGHTLQPTALVHEAYLRLVRDETARWENRAHFFGAAAEAMRRILIERARRVTRQKRGGGAVQVSLPEIASDGSLPAAEDLLALDEALTRLESQDAAMARVVKMRYFAGMSVEETAEALSLAPRTVNRLWAGARAWLHRELARRD
jgi:RNA polymerase sigma factor (TIGR02999 family)